MAAKPFRMSPEVRSQILGTIRAGGYPHVAAEAWGMTKKIFDDGFAAAKNPRPASRFARSPGMCGSPSPRPGSRQSSAFSRVSRKSGSSTAPAAKPTAVRAGASRSSPRSSPPPAATCCSIRS